MKILLDPNPLTKEGGAPIEPIPVTETSTIVARTDPGDIYTPNAGEDLTRSLPDDIDKKVVNIDDFTKIIQDKDPNYVPPVVKEEVKKEEVKKTAEDNKSGDKVSDQILPDNKAADNKEQQIVDDDKTRYGEVASAFFPKMSKEAREFFKARLDEHKSVVEKGKQAEEQLNQIKKTGLPISYLEHPEAYTLDPKFKTSVNQVNSLEGELNVWTEQLVAIRNGDEWQCPSRDDKGNIVYSKMKASPQADVYVSSMINKCQQMIGQSHSVIQQLSSNFKQALETRKSDLQEFGDKYFPSYAGDKFKDNKYGKVMSDILESKGFKEDYLTPWFCKMYAFSMEQAQYIQKLENEAKTASASNKANGAARQPNSGDINNTPDSKRSTDIDKIPFDMNAFALAKEK